MISCPLPASGVEPIRKELGELELSDQVYLVVMDPETVVPAETNEEDRYSQVEGLGYQGISRSELHSKASDLVPEFTIYTLMTAISAVIAAAGVLLESLAVLVGSMVIAPLIGPPMATSVATVIDDDELFARTVRYQAVGSAIGMVSATAFALLMIHYLMGGLGLIPPDGQAGGTLSGEYTLVLNLLFTPVFLGQVYVAYGSNVIERWLRSRPDVLRQEIERGKQAWRYVDTGIRGLLDAVTEASRATGDALWLLGAALHKLAVALRLLLRGFLSVLRGVWEAITESR